MGGVGPLSRPAAQHIVSMAPVRQINNSRVHAGKARADTRNYNTNSAQGIYTIASPWIYDKVSKRSERGVGREGGRERLIMLAKVISSMGEIVHL